MGHWPRARTTGRRAIYYRDETLVEIANERFYIYSSHLKSGVAEEQAVAAEQVTSASAGWLAHIRGVRAGSTELSTAARSPWATVTICAIAG